MTAGRSSIPPGRSSIPPGRSSIPPGRSSIPPGRVAGIDYGRRRIGIAICDAARIIASPFAMHEPTGDDEAEAAFYRRLVHDEEIAGFVVGLPLHADGSDSKMSVEAQRFGSWLATATGRPVAFQDERFTSVEAAGKLAGHGFSRGRKKARTDAIAAQIVLSDWLEAQKASTQPSGLSSSTLPDDSRPMSRLVVGCGYLGSRVASRWLEGGDRVWAITRSPERAAELASRGIEPIVADVTREETIRDLPDVATVFWAVGFDRGSGSSHRDVHVTGLGLLLDALPGRPRPILSSSTGVWGDETGSIVDETTPAHPSREAGLVLLEAEDLVRRHRLGPGVALRFAGLYGPGRLPRLADLQAGRPLPADPETWLNLIHVDDAASVVCAAAAADSPAALYVVSDGHPVRRRDWYGHLAACIGGPPPTWDTSAPRSRGADKRVDSSRLFRDLPVTLAHPDPLVAIGQLIGPR
jgi:putative transcription antitermination factor YqgF